MNEFFTNIIAGKEMRVPQYDKEEGEFMAGSHKMSLASMVNPNGTPFDAKGIVRFMKSLWPNGVDKYAVPLLVAIGNHFGKPIDEKQAQQEVQIALTGGTPAEAQPAGSVPMPQQQGQQKIAATDVATSELKSMLSQLPENPALWKQLETRAEELKTPALKPAVDAAVEAIKTVYAQKLKSRQPSDRNLGSAWSFIHQISQEIAKLQPASNKPPYSHPGFVQNSKG